jgi:hypothetical protein
MPRVVGENTNNGGEKTPTTAVNPSLQKKQNRAAIFFMKAGAYTSLFNAAVIIS